MIFIAAAAAAAIAIGLAVYFGVSEGKEGSGKK